MAEEPPKKPGSGGSQPEKKKSSSQFMRDSEGKSYGSNSLMREQMSSRKKTSSGQRKSYDGPELPQGTTGRPPVIPGTTKNLQLATPFQ